MTDSDGAANRIAIERVRELLGRHGCSCKCGHPWEDHDDDCLLDRCLACRIEMALRGPFTLQADSSG